MGMKGFISPFLLNNEIVALILISTDSLVGQKTIAEAPLMTFRPEIGQKLFVILNGAMSNAKPPVLCICEKSK